MIIRLQYTVQETLSVPPDLENRIPMIERKKTDAEENNEPAVLNWDNIVNKGVRTKDNEHIGDVVAVTSGSIVVTSIGTRNEYYMCLCFSSFFVYEGDAIYT